MTQEDYLAHHGILGQKWGIRRYQNADGSLTDLGKKRYANQIKNANWHKKSISQKDIPFNVDSKTIDRIKARKDELRELKRSRNEPHNMENKFWKNEELVDKYANKYADDLLKDGSASGNREDLIKLIKYDDVGQNLYEEYYLRDNKKEAEQYNKALEKSMKARNRINEIEQEIADDLVGAYGNVLVTDIPMYASYRNGKMVVNSNYTVSEVLKEHMDDIIDKNIYGRIV